MNNASSSPPSYDQSVYSDPKSFGNSFSHAQPPSGASYGFPPQGGVPPPPPVMYTGAPGVVTQQPLRLHGKLPITVVCPHCRQTVTTQPRPEVGTATWLSCALIFMMGCWLGCCLIPFCIDDAKDHHHVCPNCQRTIDVYSPL